MVVWGRLPNFGKRTSAILCNVTDLNENRLVSVCSNSTRTIQDTSWYILRTFFSLHLNQHCVQWRRITEVVYSNVPASVQAFSEHQDWCTSGWHFFCTRRPTSQRLFTHPEWIGPSWLEHLFPCRTRYRTKGFRFLIPRNTKWKGYRILSY